ncbi:TRAP transporter large permease [Schinkia azotoformans]|uniref:TRAP transporter large permease n=1 Tax=Schinkia azotoformans TaxID=1454 RepID=UPI002DB5F83B|nr:TRAP transporter large permease subunit [Schinkia azotoformans]MEC1717917.1 TRAP transporter large permease subunit [Schinkia azotoformans]MEC1741050.1 TRAP transporter large permease subunit [Schinkia azotoformans]MEC1744195.1 TRAP transporter large permease subunit [Schinkia azotoformans]MEC1756647.1 TRAP transporter large permease subunit [Schinkia azotoformans]MEC1768061.1 TRAP transporter large permease subunit [Schinkia azotoformans]
MNAVPKQTLEQPMMPKSGTPLKKFSSLFFIVLALVGVIYSFMIGSAALAVFSLLFLCLFIGLPIAISLGVASFGVIYFFTTDPLPDLAGKVFSGLDNFPLMAIPFFVLAGNVFTTGGVAKRLINLANAFIGHLPGGISIAAIMACALFAAISGSSPATVVAIGSIMIPAMTKMGFPKEYGVGSIATAGSLGILIPPSVPMIVYCVTVEQSVGRMFLAGIVPGIMLAGMLAFVSYLVAKKNKYPLAPKATTAEKFKAFRESIWSLSLPIIVIGGIYSGLFTPTESAAVAVFIGLAVGLFIHKDLRLKDLPGILVESTKTTAMLFFIITMAMVFAHILTLERIPHELVAVIKDMNMGPIAFLLIVNLILFIAGQFMEPTAIITILAPILFPVAMSLGIDPIHFGIIMIVNMEIGMITPPVGLNLYVASGITKMSLIDVTKSTGPWLLATVVALVLVTFVPQISIWLPNFLYSLQ